MDIFLNDKVKELVKREYKKQASFLLNADYTEALNQAVAYSGVLELFHEKYIEGHLDYTQVKVSLQDFIKQLVDLAVILQKQQQENIELTNRALATHDDSVYVLEGKNERQKAILKQTDLKANIEKLIAETEKRYTQKFGEFNSKQMSELIVQKEFNETSEYLKFLQNIALIKFNKTNNLTPLIEAVESMAYEAVQLGAVIARAERFWQKNLLSNKTFKPFYVMFDGIKSTQKLEKNEQYYALLKLDTARLNQAIRQSDKLDLVCPFMAYKQDEIHGVFNGNMSDFVAVAKQVLKEQELRMVFSNKGISNLQFAPYGVPFDLYGPSCQDCRQKLSNPEQQTLFTFGKVTKGASNDQHQQ